MSSLKHSLNKIQRNSVQIDLNVSIESKFEIDLHQNHSPTINALVFIELRIYFEILLSEVYHKALPFLFPTQETNLYSITLSKGRQNQRQLDIKVPNKLHKLHVEKLNLYTSHRVSNVNTNSCLCMCTKQLGMA